MPTLEEIRARETSPDTYAHAERMAELVTRQADGPAMRKLAENAKRASSTTAKIYLMRDLAAELAKATKGAVPCKSGCNHCCHMATLVSVQEAKLIAKETGRKLTMPRKYNEFERYRRDYEGIPCPMLKDGRCESYSSRPFACRIHYVMDRDNTLCEIHPGVAIRAPHLNVNQYETAYVDAFGDPLAMQYADIREYFPSKP